jgi:hypothetical protein
VVRFWRFAVGGGSVVFFQYGARCSDVFDYFCCNLWFSECKRTKGHYFVERGQLDGHVEERVDGRIVRICFYYSKQTSAVMSDDLDRNRLKSRGKRASHADRMVISIKCTPENQFPVSIRPIYIDVGRASTPVFSM